MSGKITRGIVQGLRSGVFLTRERMRLIAAGLLFASALGFLYILVTSTGLSDFQGRPIGTDFSNVYAAGTYVLEGKPDAPFDPHLQHAREKAIFGTGTPFYGWHYPPFFLFVAAALAALPYLWALAVWQGTTLLLYLGVGRSILFSDPSPANAAGIDKLWLLLALAFPAVFINIGHGHNGFLTAALIGGALLLLDRRPVLAGILFGLLAYKPQFGLLIPLVLIATGRWRTFAAATTTVVALILATTAVFGVDVWTAFRHSMEFTRVIVLEDGNTGWHKIQSVFSWVRMWGGSASIAYAIQGIVILALAISLTWLWRSTAAYPLKAAALVVAALLATPYSLDYDMMALAIAIAFLAADGLKRGFGPYEKSALALLWIAPLVTRSLAEQILLPLGALSMIAVYVLIMWRALSDAGMTWNFAAPQRKAQV